MLGGVLETRLMGMSARGVRLRAGAGFPVAGRFSLLQLALDVFAGETRPGLPLRGGSLGLEAWMDPARRVRGGLGTVLGAVAYRRFTSPGEWPALLTVGVRAGVELDAWRLRAGTIVVGAHADASFGPWYSACVSAGFRRGGVRQAAW